MKQDKQAKPVDLTPFITRNSKGTVLSVPVSKLQGFISIFPTIKPSANKEVK